MFFGFKFIVEFVFELEDFFLPGFEPFFVASFALFFRVRLSTKSTMT
jgi:hypothetical protein